MHRVLLRFGVWGAIATALCCFTPVLPWVLAATGLGGLTGYLYRDDVLLAILAVFLAITGYALWRRKAR